MQQGQVDLVVVGADRIAANGRHGQQDRHLFGRRAGAGARPPVLRGGTTVHHRSHHAGRPPHSHRGTERSRGDACWRQPAHPGRRGDPQPRVRRHAAPLHHRHHHRTRHPSRALMRVAERARSRQACRAQERLREASSIHRADPWHRNLLRRNVRRRRSRGNRRSLAAVDHPVRHRHRRRFRFIASGAAWCQSSPPANTSATSVASSNASSADGTKHDVERSRSDRRDPRPRLSVGSLLVGVSFAKAAAAAVKVPLVAVHHLAGHIESLVLQNGELPLPAVVLVVSGGHTSLFLVDVSPALATRSWAARETTRRGGGLRQSREAARPRVSGWAGDRSAGATQGNDRAVAGCRRCG